ncbi:hypothetical protein BKA65DRAFT_1132 [Rhexocercosporidium sp. MPI-PUGE-AT-0058]|nr:hypothetical protein BKA65DRAFT_1132 [Rhexocercosporidium sp. MPI-PUGE-AT-0058]
MLETEEVYHGFWKPWTDFNRHAWRRQITIAEDQSRIILGVVVALLALASPAAYIVLNRFIVRIWASVESIYLSHNSRRPVALEAEPNESHRMLPRSPRRSFYPLIRETWKCSRTPDFALVSLVLLSWKMVTHAPPLAPVDSQLTAPRLIAARIDHSPIPGTTGTTGTPRMDPFDEVYTGFRWENIKARWVETVIVIILWLFSAITFGLIIWGSIASTNLISESIALSASVDCGVWVMGGEKASPNCTTGLNYLQELESSEYAKRCYRSSTGADGCNFFVAQDMPYTEVHDDACPFANELCLLGQSSAYTMRTELISSKSLGINVPKGMLFNRSTTCVPIERKDFAFASNESLSYNYGPSGMSDSTWTTTKNTWPMFPGYEVATFCNQGGSSGDWQPIPGFNSERYRFTTLMFVQSQNNYHTQPLKDPIFPANALVTPPPLRGKPLYYNADPFATVLACVDRASICTLSGDFCWSGNLDKPPKALNPTSHIEKMGYYMLDISLRRSSVCNSISMRGGNALDATSKMQSNITLPVSLPLSSTQWKVEAKALFETSLARIQIELRDYVRGRGANECNFANRIDDGFLDMCSAYQFRTVGWKNLNAAGFWLVLGLVLIIYFLSIEWKREDGQDKLLAEDLFEAIKLGLREVYSVDERG